MADTTKLSPSELAAFDSLVEHVKADASFITAIVPAVVRIVPVVVRATPVVAQVTQAVVGEAARASFAGGKGPLPGSLSADDLIALRKSLTE
jgi:hypothetical protein